MVTMVGTERGQRPERRRLRMPSAQTWETVIGIGYLVLGTNAMLLVGALPLVVLLVSTDPVTSWPALLGAGVLATPALTAGFAVFTHYSRTHGTEVIRTFWRSWAAHLRRSLAVGLLWTTTAVILVVDVLALWGATLGAVLTPVFVVLFLLATATALLALVASVERPDARLRDVLRASLYLGLRRWYLTAVSFLVLGLLAGLFVIHPALAVGLAATPLLYAVWGNSRYTLKPVLPQGSAIRFSGLPGRN
ncbi:Uncharacterized membrane protein YesL [Ruania alba]|uniref:Uncharacterized membrane protein YesL n=2 Tax=Ruania alba TaxID=648782 RepID=A0A1H5BVN6_9MICO|nr:Uncharacterized membrane protein YesL [Ruania alba]